MVAASEAGASEMPSEQKQRQAGEGILMSSPDTIQGTGEEDDDDYDDEEESDEDEDKEESEESQMAEAKTMKLSGAGQKERALAKRMHKPPRWGKEFIFL